MTPAGRCDWAPPRVGDSAARSRAAQAKTHVVFILSLRAVTELRAALASVRSGGRSECPLSERSNWADLGHHRVGFARPMNFSMSASLVANDVTKRARTCPGGTVAGSVRSVWIT